MACESLIQAAVGQLPACALIATHPLLPTAAHPLRTGGAGSSRNVLGTHRLRKASTGLIFPSVLPPPSTLNSLHHSTILRPSSPLDIGCCRLKPVLAVTLAQFISRPILHSFLLFLSPHRAGVRGIYVCVGGGGGGPPGARPPPPPPSPPPVGS